MTESLRIVVADDEPDMRDYFKKILPRLGHVVVAVAQNGRELVEQCRTHRPDLVITDIKMPDMDGIEAACALYREQRVAIILVSAHHDPKLIRRAEADQVMGYLVKPIKQSDLEPAIALAIRRSDQFRALRQEAIDLRQAMEDRTLIERAEVILGKLSGPNKSGASIRLQKLAREQNLKPVELARIIVTADETFPASREAEGQGPD